MIYDFSRNGQKIVGNPTCYRSEIYKNRAQSVFFENNDLMSIEHNMKDPICDWELTLHHCTRYIN